MGSYIPAVPRTRIGPEGGTLLSGDVTIREGAGVNLTEPASGVIEIASTVTAGTPQTDIFTIANANTTALQLTHVPVRVIRALIRNGLEQRASDYTANLATGVVNIASLARVVGDVYQIDYES